MLRKFVLQNVKPKYNKNSPKRKTNPYLKDSSVEEIASALRCKARTGEELCRNAQPN
jgi:hypothetical protein